MSESQDGAVTEEKAAAAAVERASKSLRDLRVAEIAELDMNLEDGKVSCRHLPAVTRLRPRCCAWL